MLIIIAIPKITATPMVTIVTTVTIIMAGSAIATIKITGIINIIIK